MRTVPTALLCGFAVVACQASPLQVATPEPVADSVTVPATVSEATAAAASAVTDEGLPLRFFEHAAGIIETDYFDLSGRLTQHEDLGDTDRFIRFRVLVRDANGGSAVAIQVLHNPWRPTAINRYYERAVPPDHPGNELDDGSCEVSSEPFRKLRLGRSGPRRSCVRGHAWPPRPAISCIAGVLTQS